MSGQFSAYMCIFSDITLCCIFHTSLEWDLIIIEKLQYTCTCYLLKQEDIGNKETGISLEMPLEKCWKWYFQVSRFQNSLREGKVPTPLPCQGIKPQWSDSQHPWRLLIQPPPFSDQLPNSKLHGILRGFIEDWAPGKLSSCEEDFSHLVWPSCRNVF